MANVLEDSAPVLENGTGTPYIALFKTNGSPIYEPFNNQPIGTFIVDFEYIYEEEKEDHGKIELILNNPSIVDMPELDYYRSVQLQWGYIFSSKKPFVGPVRTVLITNRNFKFGPQGLNATIEFSDASALLRSRGVHSSKTNVSFLDYLEGAVKGSQVGITVLDYSQSETHRPMVVQRIGNPEDVKEGDAAIVDENNVIVPAYSYYDTRAAIGPRAEKDNPKEYVYNTRIDTSKEYDDLVPVKLLEFDKDQNKFQAFINRFPEEYRLVMVKERRLGGIVIRGTGKNTWDQLNEAINHLPNGPYYPDGRDGKLVFHNQKSNRNVSKVYTWYGGNGELLEFSIDSKYVRSVVEASQKSDIDPDSKSVVTETTQIILNPSSGASDSKLIARWPVDNYLVSSPFIGGLGTVDQLGKIARGTAGGMSGASMGAAMGSALGPIGTVVGGLIGGFVGGSAVEGNGDPYEYPLQNYNIAEEGPITISNANDVSGGARTPLPLWRNPWSRNTIPGTQKVNTSERVFGSRQQAINYYNRQDIEYSEQDVKEVMTQWQNKFNRLSDQSSIEARIQGIETLQKLDDLVVKRKVKIVERVYPTRYSGVKYTTEEFVNSVNSQGLGNGEPFPGTTSSKMELEGGATGLELQYQNGLRNLGRAVRVLENSTKMDNDNWDQNATHKSVLVEYETEVEIPISAARILSEMPDSVMGQAVNDLVETVKNTLTARAKIVGDPTVESSMNFVIKNVSEKYSGTWYIKKVSHKINTNLGYICDIQFTKRVLTNSVTHFVSKSNAVKDKIAKIRASAKEALSSGSDKTFDNALSAVKQLQKNNPDLLYFVDMEPGGGARIQGIPAQLSTRPANVSNSEYFSNKGQTWDILQQIKSLPNTQLNK